MSVTKRNEFYSAPCSGVKRSSGFVPLTPYADNGPLSWEQVSSEMHGYANGRWSDGGPLRLTRDTQIYHPPGVPIKRVNGAGSLLAEGTTRIGGPTGAIPSVNINATLTDSQLDAHGTTAIARTEPLNPAFDLATFIGEIRAEGLPRLPGSDVRDKVKLARASGSEYLNVEFGWKPLVRGVRDFASTVNNADRIIQQHQQAANRNAPRRFDFPDLTNSRVDNTNFADAHGIGFFTGGSSYQKVFRKTWFEGDFMFFLPTGKDLNARMQRYGSYARKLLGIDLSPEVLWNLSPWSWAADWFSNTGDLMHNISAMGTDGLVLRHGYVMSHNAKLTTWYSGKHDFGKVTQTYTRTVETKLRREATPYGFGVSWEGFTPKQLAITAALGLSRT